MLNISDVTFVEMCAKKAPPSIVFDGDPGGAVRRRLPGRLIRLPIAALRCSPSCLPLFSWRLRCRLLALFFLAGRMAKGRGAAKRKRRLQGLKKAQERRTRGEVINVFKVGSPIGNFDSSVDRHLQPAYGCSFIVVAHGDRPK